MEMSNTMNMEEMLGLANRLTNKIIHLNRFCESRSSGNNSETGRVNVLTAGSICAVDSENAEVAGISSSTVLVDIPEAIGADSATHLGKAEAARSSSASDLEMAEAAGTSFETNSESAKAAETSSAMDSMKAEAAGTSSTTDYEMAEAAGTSSAFDLKKAAAAGGSSATDSGKSEAAGTSSATDWEMTEAAGTSSAPVLKKGAAAGGSSATDFGKTEAAGTSSATDWEMAEAAGTSSASVLKKAAAAGGSSATDSGKTEAAGTSSATDFDKPGTSSSMASKKSGVGPDKKTAKASARSMKRAVKHFNKMLATPEQSVQDVHLLARTLHFHHIPIQMAIAYINNELQHETYPIRMYMELYHNENTPIPAGVELTEVEKALFKVWMLTFGVINDYRRPEHDYLAVLIVSIVSYFDPNTSIPIGLFAGPEMFPDPLTLVVQLIILRNYSVISGSIEKICIEPLVQRVVQLAFPPGTSTMIDILKFGVHILQPHLSSGSEVSISTEKVVLHSMSVWKYAMNYDDVFKEYPFFPTDLCQRLNLLKMSDEQIEVARAAFPILERISDSEPTGMAALGLKLSEAKGLCRLDKHPESLEILNEIKPLAAAKVDQGLFQEILYTTAANFFKQENYSSQLEVTEELLASRMISHGPEHKETLDALLSKSVALSRLERNEEAIDVALVVYQVYRRLPDEAEFLLGIKDWLGKLFLK